jgi:hypothetical protein
MRDNRDYRHGLIFAARSGFVVLIQFAFYLLFQFLEHEKRPLLFSNGPAGMGFPLICLFKQKRRPLS